MKKVCAYYQFGIEDNFQRTPQNQVRKFHYSNPLTRSKFRILHLSMGVPIRMKGTEVLTLSGHIMLVYVNFLHYCAHTSYNAHEHTTLSQKKKYYRDALKAGV